MKTIFTLNFVNKSIVGTKSAITRANKCLEPEYSELCALLEKHPGFKVEVKKIEQKKDKKTYTGLTFDAMEAYIANLDDSEAKLVEFKTVKKVAEAKGAKYPLTKKWFLKKYTKFNEVNAYDEAMKAVALELSQLEDDTCEEETVDGVA